MKIDEIFISMMKIMCKDPSDNIITLRNSVYMKYQYIIYTAIAYLIKIGKLIENNNEIEYHIVIPNIYDELECQQIINELIKQYFELHNYNVEICEVSTCISGNQIEVVTTKIKVFRKDGGKIDKSIKKY